MAGGEALLPCNIAIPKESDVLSLIYWYREAPKSPIYTLDFRKGRPEDARHFPGKELDGRAHFETAEYPPTLKVKPTKVEDEGVYKCRIEYKRARIVTRLVKLVVIGEYWFWFLKLNDNFFFTVGLIQPGPKCGVILISRYIVCINPKFSFSPSLYDFRHRKEKSNFYVQ